MSSETADPKIGTLVADRYRLDEHLAAGGMGVVYKGVDLKTKRPIAVKFVHEAFAGQPTLVKRFQREVAAMQRLSHPNLVAIIDSGVQAEVPYLVMDFHAGSSLTDLLDQGAFAAPRALDLARQLLAGVAAVHKGGVVHRDLKPDNVLVVDENGAERIKILDFGLAKLLSEHGATQLTNTGFALGTPGYMAPEQARGGDTDERTDVYAVGVILYHMVTGRRPFVAESPMAVLRMHMDDPPLPPRKATADRRVSPALDSAILRALEKLPARRWQSAVEFANALAETPEAHGQAVDPAPSTIVQPTFPKLPARRWERWLLLVVVVAGGALAWSRLSHHKQREVKETVQRAVDGPVKQAVQGVEQVLRKVVEPPPPDRDEEVEAPNHDTPGVRLEAAAPAKTRARRPPTVDEAARLLSAGKLDDAIQLLYQVRHQAPRSPTVPLLLGHAYFRKLWRSDGLREYDTALQLKPALRRDRTLLKNVVAALDDPTSQLARNLVRAKVGAAALPELRRAAREAKSPKVQKRAGRLAAEVAHHH